MTFLKPLSTALLILFLSGCSQAENPLKSQNLEEVALFLYENSGPALGPCAESWARPQKSNNQVRMDCENVAFLMAQKLTNKGYGDINSTHIHYPKLWLAFENIVKAQKLPKKPFEWGAL